MKIYPYFSKVPAKLIFISVPVNSGTNNKNAKCETCENW